MFRPPPRKTALSDGVRHIGAGLLFYMAGAL